MPLKRAILSCIILAVLMMPASASGQEPVNSVADWFTDGIWHFDSRYRLERVEQDGFAEDALASTLRLQGGFETATWNGFSALAEVELVRPLGNERFNSTTNGETVYPIIADPDSTELNQAYLYYRRAQNHVIAGRQLLPIRQERFLGSVDFRQNQQTFDALMLMNRSIPGLQLTYGYMDRVRRFLSDDNPLGDVEMNSHIVDLEYESANSDRLTFYMHFLDMETPALSGRSHRNIGLRYEGMAGKEALKWLYHLEYADQSSYANGLSSIDADYVRAEIGPKFRNQWVLRAGIENLSGNGTYAFQTPFATGHSYNGHADVFAAGTPGAGLHDRYLKLEIPVYGVRIDFAYHQFDSDQGSIDYGSEFDITLSLRFRERFLLAFEFADYDAKELGVDKQNVSLSLRYQL